MTNLLHKKEQILASFGILLLMLASLLALWDKQQSDALLLHRMEQEVQAEFDAQAGELIASLSAHSPETKFPVCQLRFSEQGKLVHWTQPNFLPPYEAVEWIKDIPVSPLLALKDNRYYQIRKTEGDSVSVFLIPLYIKYRIENDFLRPYLFLGSYQEKMRISDLQQIQVGTSPLANSISIKQPNGQALFFINNIPVTQLHAPIRIAVLMLALLGIIISIVSFYQYARSHPKWQIWRDFLLCFQLIFLRGVLWFFHLPQDYVSSSLFSDSLLYIPQLIPSLGDLLLHSFVICMIVWVLYRNLAGVTWWWASLVQHKKGLSTFLALFSLMLMVGFIVLHIKTFEWIVQNSQMEIDFSNIFRTNIYSYIFIISLGFWLLSLFFLFLLLLPWVVQWMLNARLVLLAALGLVFIFWISLYLNHITSSWIIVWGFVLMFLVLVIGRMPGIRVIRYDLLNYLLLILSFSIVASRSMVNGSEIRKDEEAVKVAGRAFESRVDNIVSAFNQSLLSIGVEKEEIDQKWKVLAPNDFVSWLRDTYFAINFNSTQIELFIVEAESDQRTDTRTDKKPFVFPSVDLVEVFKADRLTRELELYQMPYQDEILYDDVYIGRFQLAPKDGKSYICQLDIYPNPLETEKVYPELLRDRRNFPAQKLLQKFEYALYRNGRLYSSSAESPFPSSIDTTAFRVGKFVNQDAFRDYIVGIEGNKQVRVRFKQTVWTDYLNTFSFLFFFYALFAIGIIAINLLIWTWIKEEHPLRDANLRTKIQLVLLTVGMAPLLMILLFLMPFIRDRYYAQVHESLRSETARISDAVNKSYRELRQNPIGLSSAPLLKQFQKNIQELGAVLRNDINVYDETGRLIATTQPLITMEGISSGLMNEKAYEKLRYGTFSETVQEENIGKLHYFSGYGAIFSKRPIGYVNVPYLTKQEEVDQQVFDLLAFLANIYLAVLLLIGIFTLIVSRTTTRPLLLLQQRLAETRLGNKNEPIPYEANDEIGDIIRAYNQMVDKLDESEKRLAQTEREGAWKQMARQVAHEIKNPLTPMKLSLQHLSRLWDEQSEKLQKQFPRVMNTLLMQIDSLARIADNFAEFAKMPEPVREWFELKKVILEVSDLYAQSENVELHIELQEQDFEIYADREQISRVFNNIIKNAIQAIEGTGNIWVTNQIEGKNMLIQIRDDGKGIPEEIRNRIFEPNFSTKTSGMGLGLAIVKRIVESANGRLWFETEDTQGTTFFVELPGRNLNA